MPTRPSVPAPKPLTPRGAAYVSRLFEETAERQRVLQKAVSVAYDEGAASTTRPVAKAKAKPDQCAVYDANGNLVGTVDPDSITMIAAAKAPDGPDTPPTDLTAAPPASVGTPADAVPPTATPAAKAMSLGARGSQLGGEKPGPAAGVPVAPAEPVEEQEVVKARAQQMAAEMKKALAGGNGGSAAEANRVANAMNEQLIKTFAAMQRSGLAPGSPRHP